MCTFLRAFRNENYFKNNVNQESKDDFDHLWVNTIVFVNNYDNVWFPLYKLSLYNTFCQQIDFKMVE